MKLFSDEELATILDSQPIFRLIGRVADEAGVECYVVGGYVRDLFLERPNDDIDIVVVGSGIDVATRLKKQLGRKAHLSVFKTFGTAQVKAPLLSPLGGMIHRGESSPQGGTGGGLRTRYCSAQGIGCGAQDGNPLVPRPRC